MSRMSEIHAELSDLLGRALDVADEAGLDPRNVAALLDEMIADAEATQAAARLEAAGAPLPRTDVHMLERVDVHPAWSPEDRAKMADALGRAIDERLDPVPGQAVVDRVEENLDVEVQPWQAAMLAADGFWANQIAVRPSIYPPIQATRVFTADDVAAIEDGAQ